MPSLKGKTLFITGASRGIGRAIGLRAARDGANVVIAAKTSEPHATLPGTIHTAAREMEEAGIQLPVIEAHCVYKQGARYDDDVDIRTRAVKLSPLRVQFDYQAIRRADGQLLATGHTVHVAIDRDGRVMRLPDQVKDLFS